MTDRSPESGAQHDRASADGPRATDLCVAICTHNRPAQLRRALTALLAQTLPPAEILVVDNAPVDDATRALIQRQFATVRYVCEPIPGLDFARNRALTGTSCGIVAFIDDDAVAAPDWVAAIAAMFREHPHMAVCTGKVTALSLETEGQRLFEANGGFDRGDTRICLPGDTRRRLYGLRAPLIAWVISSGFGCSLAVRRQTLLDLGGFDEALDMGAALPGGGEHDIIWRALNAGYEVIYEPTVQIRHEHRREVEATVQQICGHNRALIVMLTKFLASARGMRRLSVLIFLLWRLIKPVVRLMRRVFGRDPLPVSVLLRLTVAGWGSLGSYRIARNLARQRIAAAAQTSVRPAR